jgi:hypothetical protein
MENFAAVNWLAVGVGVVVSFLVGWLWYSPKLFGVKWAEGSGVTLDSADKMPAFAMLAQVTALLILSTVVGLTAAIDALITAILAILAAATFVLSNGSWSQKSCYARLVDFFYVVLSGVIMIVCQGIF